MVARLKYFFLCPANFPQYLVSSQRAAFRAHSPDAGIQNNKHDVKSLALGIGRSAPAIAPNFSR
jgi:hypothetical protein